VSRRIPAQGGGTSMRVAGSRPSAPIVRELDRYNAKNKMGQTGIRWVDAPETATWPGLARPTSKQLNTNAVQHVVITICASQWKNRCTPNQNGHATLIQCTHPWRD
jgi:hypothetical protein